MYESAGERLDCEAYFPNTSSGPWYYIKLLNKYFTAQVTCLREF